MVAIWRDSADFNHCFLIIPISIFLIWLHRHRMKHLTPMPEALGLLFLVGLVISWLLADLASVQVVQHFSLMAMIPMLTLSLSGRLAAKAMIFPLAYLLFAVPMGDALIPFLMEVTIWFAVTALRLFNIEVIWEGRFFSISGGSFEVAEACSGLRYLIAAVPLGCLYAYLNYRSLWRRFLFITLAVLLPVLANCLRVFAIALLFHLGERRLAQGIHHALMGWGLFAVIMAVLFSIGWRLRERRDEQSAEATTEALNNSLTSKNTAYRPLRALVVTIEALIILASGPLVARWLQTSAAYSASQFVLHAPSAPKGWSGPMETNDDWQPQFQGADTLLHCTYTRDGRQVSLFIAYYRRQRQGKELINSANKLYDGKQWRHVADAPGAFSRAASLAVPIHETSLRHLAGAHKLVWHWYNVAGGSTGNPYMLKMLEALSFLQRTYRGSALVAIAADYNIHPDEARPLLREFLISMEPALQTALANP
jgi:exosortase A